MPVGFSADLRWRIVYLVCLQGKTIAQAAKDLYVSQSTEERIVHLYRTTGDVVSVQETYGPPRKLSEFEELTVLESFFKYPGIYLREVQELIRLTGTTVDCSTICRTAKRLGLTRQKMRKIAVKQSDAKRAEYMVGIEVFDPEMLVFIDETGCDKRNLVRQYGYGVRGLTPVTHKFVVHGKRVSAIGIMTTEGIEDAYLVEGNVNSDTFLRFIQRSLLNIIQPFDGSNPKSVVILDNASIHHVDAVVDLITAAGALVRFLPPYSPDLNPIEEVFSQVKSYIKDNEIIYKTTKEPRLIVASAFASITTQDCQNYIRHAGYIE